MVAIVGRPQSVRVLKPKVHLPRPGRRAFSGLFGLALLAVAVDAVLHPGSIDGLWSLQATRSMIAPVLGAVVEFASMIILAAVIAAVFRVRRLRTRKTIQDWPSPIPFRRPSPIGQTAVTDPHCRAA